MQWPTHLTKCQGLAITASEQVPIMSVRTTDSKVTFRRPFLLASLGSSQPAGTYRLEIDEEEIAGPSFAAFQRTATMLHLPAPSATSGLNEIVPVDPAELAAALAADARD